MDVGRAVVGGEVGERPHRVALHVVVGGELEEVESHLVTMGLLFRFAGADGDQLREVQLLCRGMSKKVPHSVDNGGVHHQLA